MSNRERRPYLTATVLDQDFLNACQDNLECKLELILDIETPTGFIRVSDRPKYVDGVYYDNRLKFPLVSRTAGEWLSTEIELSVLKFELNNADGEYDEFLPGGANYDGFIGRSVEVKLGLRDLGGTYTTIFRGKVSDIGGFARTVKSVLITARDDYDKLNVTFPKTVFTQTNFPDISDDVAGLGSPVIYGIWTTDGNPQTDQASVPAYPINGQGALASTATNATFIISENALLAFDNSAVFVKKGDKYYLINIVDVTNISGDNRQFDIVQDSGSTLIEGANFVFADGDLYFVKVAGKDLGAYSENIVEIARDILKTQAGALVGDFDANWDTFRDKITPAQSSISTIKARVWLQEPQSVLSYVLSMLEQVRLEMFIDRNLKLKLNSLHFEDFNAAPTHSISNFDTVRSSLKPTLDVRNNFNRAQGVFNFLPDINENSRKTSVYQNTSAVTQMKREISKEITFPNLYVSTDVSNQLIEVLRLASAAYEHVFLEVTWRSLLLDIGDYVFLDVKIGSTIYENIPCMVRDIGYDPEGIKLPIRLWSFQVVPFPGFAGVTGSVGGYNATITEE